MSPKVDLLHHDFETFGTVNLKKVGASRYARDTHTEVLMCSYALNRNPVAQWVPVEGDRMPAKLEDAILDERVLKLAWNKNFEWNIWKHVLDIEIPHNQWRDPMVLAMSLSLPGKLDKACPIVDLPLEYQKAVNGTVLMNWFSKMRPATKRLPERRIHWYEKPDKWAEYKEYNIQDTIAERAFWRRMVKYDMLPSEWELWFLDQEINEDGIPIDLAFARHADEVKDRLIEIRLDKMARLTGLANPNSRDQLLQWLREHGYQFDDLMKGHVQQALESSDIPFGSDLGPAELAKLAAVLRLRSEVSRSSVKKFTALVEHTDEDGVLRGTLQFNGAQRTQRWAGRVFQAHNLAKPTKALEGLKWAQRADGAMQVVGGDLIDCLEAVRGLDADDLEMIYANPMDMVSACVRPVVCAKPGYLLVDADLRAIENVILGWLADDRKILKVFSDKLDPYISFATYLYDRTYDDLMAAYKDGERGPRTVAKPGVLGCGYMLSAGSQYENHSTGEIEATGLLGYAWGMGVRLTPAEAEHSVSVWRETYKEAVKFWYKISNAAMATVRTGKPHDCGKVGFDRKGPFLRMILPSGRPLWYVRPRLEQCMMPWGKWREALTYEGIDNRGQWVRIQTHPGKITENADQAIARDILAHGMTLARKEGIRIRLHVHDQNVAMIPEDLAGEQLTVLRECMETRPSWASDMPIAAAGHVSKWFVKD